jgi:uncharacterized delta-60 repeat protein
MALAVPAFGVSGALDPTYDGDGKVLTDIASLHFEQANAIVTQSDGKSVVAGSGQSIDGTGAHFALARYDLAGHLDPTFDGDGQVITDFAGSSEQAFGLARQADGKLVAAGYTDLVTPGGGKVFALARYLPNGSLDPSFGTGGRVLTNIAASDEEMANAVLIQPDGRIVAGGSMRVGGRHLFLVARYEANGTLQQTYTLRDFDSPAGFSDARINALSLGPDGKLVAAGTAVLLHGGNAVMAVARYDAGGGLDASFGSSGQATIAACSGASIGNAVLIQAGKPVVAGQCVAGGSGLFALARLTTTGTLDTSFGLGGVRLTQFQVPGAAEARAVAVDRDGTLIAAGSATVGGQNQFTLMRYSANGAPLAGSPILSDFATSTNERIQAIALEHPSKNSPFKLVAAGSAFVGSDLQLALARYR